MPGIETRFTVAPYDYAAAERLAAALGVSHVLAQVLVRRALWLVYPREARLSPPVQAVIHFVLDVMRAHAARVEGVTA